MTGPIAYAGVVDWRLFRRAQMKHVGWRWAFLLLFPVLMLAFAAFSLTGAPFSIYLEVFGGALIFVPLMLAFSFFHWRRIFTKSPYLRDAISGSVSDEKFVAQGPTGTTEIPWSRFVKMKDGGDFLLCYHSPVLFNILARQFFQSDQAWEEAKRIALRSQAAA